MRIFQTLQEATSEIERDLFKAPVVLSTSVQHLKVNTSAREALNYVYTISPGGMPTHAHDLVKFGQERFPSWEKTSSKQLVTWITSELESRLYPLKFKLQSSEAFTEEDHPVLSQLVEGNAYAYTYPDRLVGMVETLQNTLIVNPTSRRAYWPIFSQQDSFRAVYQTRVPCSIGYQVMVRQQPGIGPQLHLTYLQRSSDYYTFWLSDLWFAYKIQEYLSHSLVPIELGGISHVILSFHYFPEKEIY